MRIRADEHVSLEIVGAIRKLVLRDGWELTSVLDTSDRGSSDVHWVTKFAGEGGHVILSADTDFLRVPAQVLAVFQTGLRVIHLPSKWANAKCHLQMAHILIWWERIETTISTMRPRQCFGPVWNIDQQASMKEIKFDFAAAQKKRKRETKR